MAPTSKLSPVMMIVAINKIIWPNNCNINFQNYNTNLFLIGWGKDKYITGMYTIIFLTRWWRSTQLNFGLSVTG